MTLSDRDRRILVALVPILLLVVYWFLLLSPKRDDLSAARDAQTQAEEARDQAVAQVTQLERARETFARDYAAVVRLGKAIPAQVDAPSLLVQLDRASRGTQVDFNSVTFGARATATVTPVAATTATPAQPAGNAAAGGAPAQTAPGQAAESAQGTAQAGNQASTNVDQASGGQGATTDTTTTAATTAAAPAPATLDTVPLTFNFTGTYFDLADFFHRLKRFVYLANDNILVRGRLVTIDSLAFAPGSTTGATTTPGGTLTATLGATVYLAPQAQGPTGGATPAGPGGTDTTATPAPSGAQTSSLPLATVGANR